MEKLYLKSFSYNTARILSKLAVIIEDNGGKVKPAKSIAIINRSILEARKEALENIERVEGLKNVISPEKIHSAEKGYKKDLEKLEKVKNEPVEVTHTAYISFVYDSFYYYYQVDENPFFGSKYIKTPVKNKKYSGDACLTEINNDSWLYDCFLGWDCPNADIVEAAYIIFNMLTSAPISEKYRETKRHRVPNTYNGGYHYETIYSPEKFAAVDF